MNEWMDDRDAMHTRSTQDYKRAKIQGGKRIQESQKTQELQELRRNIIKYSHFAAKNRKALGLGLGLRF